MLVDGPDDVGVGVEVLPVVLPEVGWGQQQASMLREQVPELPKAWQQVGHLRAHLCLLYTSDAADDCGDV